MQHLSSLVVFVVIFVNTIAGFTFRGRHSSEQWPYVLNPLDEFDASLQHFVNTLIEKSTQYRMLDSRYSSFETVSLSTEDPSVEATWSDGRHEQLPSTDTVSILPEKLRRNIEQLPNLFCQHHGIPKVITSTKNKCHGVRCYISEILCDGRIYNLSQYEGPIDQCYVLSLNCYVLANATKKIEFPSGECVPQRFLCNETLTSPQNMTSQEAANCFAQIRCNSTFYGFEVWDYFCESTDLLCNGTRMFNYTGLSVDPEHCQIVTRPCTSVDANSTCDNAEIECDLDRWDAVCANVIDYSSPYSLDCNKSCTLQKIKCGNMTYAYTNYTGSLLPCNVAEIVCSDQNVTITMPENDICRIVELDCNGTLRTFFGSIPSGCSVAKVICAPLSNIINCTLYKFGCEMKTCHYKEKNSPCYDYCVQNSTYLGCECPVDYDGIVCQNMRPVECRMLLLEPLYTCPLGPQPELTLSFDPDTGEIPYDSDPQCYVFNSTDEIRLKFQLSCKFLNFNYSRKNVEASNFTYEVITDTIAFSEVPQWFVIHKIFNFVMLSDTTASTLVRVSKEIFEGKAPLVFTIRPKELDAEKYIVGDRIYSEFKFAKAPQGPSVTPTLLYKIFIDIADYAAIHQTFLPRSFPWIPVLLGVAIGGMAAFLTGGLLWLKCRRPLQSKEIK
jgi:hypothetical protein